MPRASVELCTLHPRHSATPRLVISRPRSVCIASTRQHSWVTSASESEMAGAQTSGVQDPSPSSARLAPRADASRPRHTFRAAPRKSDSVGVFGDATQRSCIGERQTLAFAALPACKICQIKVFPVSLPHQQDRMGIPWLGSPSRPFPPPQTLLVPKPLPEQRPSRTATATAAAALCSSAYGRIGSETFHPSQLSPSHKTCFGIVTDRFQVSKPTLGFRKHRGEYIQSKTCQAELLDAKVSVLVHRARADKAHSHDGGHEVRLSAV